MTRYITADQRGRYRLMTLCDCIACEATGKVDGERCSLCRGEGRNLSELGDCGSPEALGVFLVTAAREGDLDCPHGVIDTMAEEGERKWLWRPWSASAREVSEAARVLAKSKGGRR